VAHLFSPNIYDVYEWEFALEHAADARPPGLDRRPGRRAGGPGADFTAGRPGRDAGRPRAAQALSGGRRGDRLPETVQRSA